MRQADAITHDFSRQKARLDVQLSNGGSFVEIGTQMREIQAEIQFTVGRTRETSKGPSNLRQRILAQRLGGFWTGFFLSKDELDL